MKKPGNAVSKVDSPITGRGKAKVVWQGYVNVTINESMKRGLVELGDLGAFVDKSMRDLEDGVYDVKIRWDSYNQCWQASLYCTFAGHPNAGWCLALRGSDWFSALGRLLYIHFMVYETLWSTDGKVGWSDEQW